MSARHCSGPRSYSTNASNPKVSDSLPASREVAAKSFRGVDQSFRPPGEDEAVADAGSAAQRRLLEAAEPDRDLPAGPREDRGPVDPVPLTPVVEQRLGPETTEQVDLFLAALPFVREVLVQRFVLDVVPAEPDTQAQPAAREEVELGSLLRDERRLPLRKDQDSGPEPDPRRDPGDVAQHHEWLVERIVLGVRAPELRIASLVLRAEDVVVDQHVRVAEILGRLREVAHGHRIAVEPCLRERDSNLHSPSLSHPARD